MAATQIKDVVEQLQQAEDRYAKILEQYREMNEKYTNLQAFGKTEEANLLSAQMTQVVSALGNELNEMKRILNSAYNEGETRQSLSASAGSALELQDAIMEQRSRQYKDARDRLAHIIGEESSTGLNVVKNRNMYQVYFVLAIALFVSIIFMFMGGSLPTGVLIIMIVVGVYIGWEFYKSWLGSISNKFGGKFMDKIGVPSISGVFRIVT
jgi:cell fate (sporulation/competence/biofilm development) regulator YlbF (YheA/YmcA/DUF963 family)